MTDALGNPVDDAGDHHAAVAVAGEHHVVQILEQDQIHDVVDVGLQVDVGAVEVFTLAEAGERGAVNGVAIVGEEFASALPFPAARGGAVDERRKCSARRVRRRGRRRSEEERNRSAMQ